MPNGHKANLLDFRQLRRMWLGGILSAAISCNGATEAPAAVARVIVTPGSSILPSGGTVMLVASAQSADGGVLSGRTLTWSSSNNSVATVNANGLVTAAAIATGSAETVRISATSESKTGSAEITVQVIPVSQVSVNALSGPIAESDSAQLTVVTRDSTGGVLTGRSITWSTANASVATVSADGRLIATPYAGDVPSRSTTVTATTEGKSGTTQVVVTIDYARASTFFTSAPNAMPSLGAHYAANGGGAGNMTVPVIADLNRDGREDLVLHLWRRITPLEASTRSRNAPSINRLVALIANADGSYTDRTVELFGSTAVDVAGSVSRKARVADINNDGYPDWVYALNREDGRLLFEDSWSTQSAAVLSNGNGTWRVEVFGTFKYHHSVDVFRGPGGQWTVIFDGNDFNAPDTYLFQGGSFVPAPGYPPRAIGTIATYSSAGTANVDRFLTDGSGFPPSMRLFRWTGTAWTEDSRFEWPSWREITILYGNGVVERNIVRQFQGMEYVSGGFFESCVLRPVLGGPPTLVVQLNAALVTGGTAGRDTISQSQMRPWARLFAFQPAGTKLVDTDLFSEREGPYNANFVWCLDVNRDGYEDVVRHPYHDGARPVVLLNDGGGRLQRLPDTKFPAGPNGWSSLLIDSDGDGIRDVLYFPGNGCGGGSCTTYQLHRGRRQLR